MSNLDAQYLTSPAEQLRVDCGYVCDDRSAATGYALIVWDADGNASIREGGAPPEDRAGRDQLRAILHAMFWKKFGENHRNG